MNLSNFYSKPYIITIQLLATLTLFSCSEPPSVQEVLRKEPSTLSRLDCTVLNSAYQTPASENGPVSEDSIMVAEVLGINPEDTEIGQQCNEIKQPSLESGIKIVEANLDNLATYEGKENICYWLNKQYQSPDRFKSQGIRTWLEELAQETDGDPTDPLSINKLMPCQDLDLTW